MPPPLDVRQTSSEADINSVNEWMRAQPWYHQLLTSMGQDPAQGIHLSNDQAQQVMQAAQANGIQVDMGDIEVDPSGNFNPKGHKLRNALIAAAIGGGALLTGGAALGAFGAGGGAAGGAGAATGVGLGGGAVGGTAAAGGAAGLGATTIGTGFIPAIAGGTGFGAGGAAGALAAAGGAGAALGGSGAGAASALEAGAVPGLGGSGLGGAPALLGSTSTLGASALPAGGTGLAGVSTGGSALAGAGSKIKDMMRGNGGGAGDGLSDAASVLGDYAQSQADGRKQEAELTQNRDRLMLQAQQDRRTNESDALKKIQQGSYIQSGGRPFSPAMSNSGQKFTQFGFGPQAPSDAQKQAAATLQGQLLARLGPDGSFTPTPIPEMTQQGTGERAANWGALGLGALGAARKFF